MPLQIVRGDDIRVCPKSIIKFQDLIQYIQKTFQNISPQIRLYYMDESDDMITISCDEDLQCIELGSTQIIIEEQQIQSKSVIHLFSNEENSSPSPIKKQFEEEEKKNSKDEKIIVQKTESDVTENILQMETAKIIDDSSTNESQEIGNENLIEQTNPQGDEIVNQEEPSKNVEPQEEEKEKINNQGQDGISQQHPINVQDPSKASILIAPQITENQENLNKVETNQIIANEIQKIKNEEKPNSIKIEQEPAVEINKSNLSEDPVLIKNQEEKDKKEIENDSLPEKEQINASIPEKNIEIEDEKIENEMVTDSQRIKASLEILRRIEQQFLASKQFDQQDNISDCIRCRPKIITNEQYVSMCLNCYEILEKLDINQKDVNQKLKQEQKQKIPNQAAQNTEISVATDKKLIQEQKEEVQKDELFEMTYNSENNDSVNELTTASKFIGQYKEDDPRLQEIIKKSTEITEILGKNQENYYDFVEKNFSLTMDLMLNKLMNDNDPAPKNPVAPPEQPVAPPVNPPSNNYNNNSYYSNQNQIPPPGGNGYFYNNNNNNNTNYKPYNNTHYNNNNNKPNTVPYHIPNNQNNVAPPNVYIQKDIHSVAVQIAQMMGSQNPKQYYDIVEKNPKLQVGELVDIVLANLK